MDTVGWQIDIGGLTSLMLKLSAAGLKQLAMAEVDLHAIGCMWKIAEICPASNEYRSKMSNCRQEQRSQSTWLYKIVEVGSATNFVVDEFLKNRAGENVVALMSAILPFMTDAVISTLLLDLFNSMRVPDESTPGYKQLRAIWIAIEPMARKMSFPHKVFRCHYWMKDLLDPSAIKASAYDCIPSEKTAVSVIIALSRLASGDPNAVVAYYGLKGAAWVASYARYVLGLPVCVMRSVSDSIPMNADYRTSRVRLYIYDERAHCEIQVEGIIDEYIVAESLELAQCTGWTIDTMRVNLLNTYFPDSTGIKRSISSFIGSLVYEYTEIIAKGFSIDHSRNDYDNHLATVKLEKYPVYCLPAVRNRARRILVRFGLDFGEVHALRPKSWRRFVVPTDDLNHCGPRPGPEWPNCNSCYVEESEVSAEKTLRFSKRGYCFIQFAWKLAQMASWLAFTDWGDSLHTVSVSFLEDYATTPVSYNSLVHVLNFYPWNTLSNGNDLMIDYLSTPPITGISDLVNFATAIAVIQTRGSGGLYSETDNAAFYQIGVVIVDTMAIRQVLDLEACFIRLIPGAIIANGEKRDRIYSSPVAHHLQSELREYHSVNTSSDGLALKPFNAFPTIEVLSRVELSNSNVSLAFDILIDGELWRTNCSFPASRVIANVYVTESCEHHYYDEYFIQRPDTSKDAKRDPSKIRSIEQGLCVLGGSLGNSFDHSLPPAHKCYIQQVDQNACGQWIACMNAANFGPIVVLQRNACLKCICERFEQFCGKMSSNHPYQLFIIPGRFQGEEMT